MSKSQSPTDQITLDETPYQVMPELDAEEYRALKADIEENGIIVPITVDGDGQIIEQAELDTLQDIAGGGRLEGWEAVLGMIGGIFFGTVAGLFMIGAI